jgi:hypothetical protein
VISTIEVNVRDAKDLDYLKAVVVLASAVEHVTDRPAVIAALNTLALKALTRDGLTGTDQHS